MNILDYTLPVCITSFDRPHYLKRCLKSLEEQSDLDNVEFMMAQDGAYLPMYDRNIGDPAKVEECIQLFKDANLPNKSIIVQKHNIGIAINHQLCYDQMFDYRNRRAMILSEDDLVYSRDWLRCTKILLRQFKDNPRIATVQASVYAGCGRLSENEIKLYESAVSVGKPNWLGFAIWKNRWERIKPRYMQYFHMVKQYIYALRDHSAIQQWFWENWGLREPMTSQDRAKEWACVMAGMTRAYTVVNRAHYIGEKGVHGVPENYRNAAYHKAVIRDIPADVTRERFDDVNEDMISMYIIRSMESGVLCER